MDTSNLNLVLANLVMVFDDLNDARISRDHLLDAIPGTKPDNFDLGKVIIVKYSEHRAETLVLVETNRVEVKISRPDDASWGLIPALARNVFKSISRSGLKAYGYNVFADVPMPESQDANIFLLRQFAASLETTSEQLEGELTSMEIRFHYVRDGSSYQLHIKPLLSERDLMRFEMNKHFDTVAFPSEAELARSYVEFVDVFKETIGNLFAGD